MVDSELVRKFIAVAEELNFSRAAERLGIAQPPLSRAMRQLERRLGVTLFERTSRRVSLTHAGIVLLHEGRRALLSLDAAARRAQRAGHSAPQLVCVTKPGSDAGLLEPILTRYAADPDAVEVELTLCGIGEQESLLREGHADVAMLRLPHDDPTGFATEELLVEGEVVVLPRTHRLAGRESVRMADLAGETLPRWSEDSPADGPLVRDSGQLTQLIVLGRTIALLPESIRDQLRSDLVAIPVVDGTPSTLILAWSEESRSRALAAFVRAAVDVAGRARVAS